MGEAWRNRQFAQHAGNGRGNSRLAPLAIVKRRRHQHRKEVWGARNWTGTRTTRSEELPDDMNVSVTVAQDKAAMRRYPRKAPRRRA